MRTTISILALALTCLGCATTANGPAAGREAEFKRLVVETGIVKNWGYKIAEVRFSGDYQKALVVLSHDASDKRIEAILEHDGFRRYSGRFDLGTGAYAPVTISFPAR